MVDLTKYVDPLKSSIDDRIVTETHREYLGLSSIGEECYRKQWYSWRWVTPKQVTYRMRRLLNRGDAEELIIIKDLESVGMTITNEQAEIVHPLVGKHCMGHIDGEVVGVPYAPEVPHLLEMKTMADKYFARLVLNGLRRSEPKYYDQLTTYMHYRKLDWSLFVATNKNNDKRKYIRIKADPEHAKELHRRATDIVSHEHPPARISKDPSNWKCKFFCSYRDVCFGYVLPLINCRTCKSADLEDDGAWHCSYYDSPLPVDTQRVGCKNHARAF